MVDLSMLQLQYIPTEVNVKDLRSLERSFVRRVIIEVRHLIVVYRVELNQDWQFVAR